MSTPNPATVRRAGLAAVAGGVLTAASGLLVQGVVVPASDVSDEMWSYPWSSSALVPVSVVYTVFHLLVAVGIVGFGRTGAAGPGRAARAGVAVAVGGTLLLAVAELLSIPVADQRMDDTGPGLVGALFGIGTVLTAIGFLVTGVTTLRATRWQGWRRWMPLALGLWTVALTALVMTPALAAAVGIYGALLAALGMAVATDPVPAAARDRAVVVRV